MTLDPDLAAQRRANFDAGASKGSLRWILVVIALVLLLGIGGCGAFAWFGFGQWFGLGERIREESGGRVEHAQIFGLGGQTMVQVILAKDVTEAQGKDVICTVVVPRLTEAGISHPTIQLAWFQGTTISMEMMSPPECSP